MDEPVLNEILGSVALPILEELIFIIIIIITVIFIIIIVISKKCLNCYFPPTYNGGGGKSWSVMRFFTNSAKTFLLDDVSPST